MYVAVLVALVLCVLCKLLQINNSPERPSVLGRNLALLSALATHAPSLHDVYRPTRLWGYSGHVQTIIQGLLSRIWCPLVNGKRYFFVQPDGSTVTYDLYQPTEQHTLNGDFTLAICPGICNSSESVYIRRVVCQSQAQGYRVAVLNHVGALKNVPITSPRIFTYGNTNDYDGMIQELVKRFPGTRIVCVGFSMGGNIVTKYLGEDRQRPSNIVAGVSVCQGYDAKEASKYLLGWEGGRRLYLFVMTENMRAILRRWQKQLFTEEMKKERGLLAHQAWSAATLVELDDVFTRKLENYETVEELYRRSSCVHHFDNIRVPVIFINSVDDPIVAPPLLRIIKNAAAKHENFVYIEHKYGGHLGFYEQGFVCPNQVTWLDRHVPLLADALCSYVTSAKKKPGLVEAEFSDDHDFVSKCGMGGDATGETKWANHQAPIAWARKRKPSGLMTSFVM